MRPYTAPDTAPDFTTMMELSSFGYAYHEIITDQAGQPVDYRFLEVNSEFEHLTGLKRKEILGKGVCEVLPGIRDGEFDWVAFYGEVALKGTEICQHSFRVL